MIGVTISKVEKVKENGPRGSRIFARFNVALGHEVYVNDCALLYRGDHGWSIWGPTRSVKFTTRIRREIKLAVLREIGMEVPPQMAEET